jgi:hypothetical protein
LQPRLPVYHRHRSPHTWSEEKLLSSRPSLIDCVDLVYCGNQHSTWCPLLFLWTRSLPMKYSIQAKLSCSHGLSVWSLRSLKSVAGIVPNRVLRSLLIVTRRRAIIYGHNS